MNNTPSRLEDPLFQVERRIARRADELDRQFGVSFGHTLDHWHQAEQEIWSATAKGTAWQAGRARSVASAGETLAAR